MLQIYLCTEFCNKIRTAASWVSSSVAECGFKGHAYTDNTYVYISTPADDAHEAVDRLTTCIMWIRDWMARNHLKLNEDKTPVIRLDTCYWLDKVMVQNFNLPNAMVSFTTVVNNLGTFSCSQLTMTNQIAALSRSCFFYLWRIWSIKQSLTPDTTRTLIGAFVSSRLDSCNSLLAGVSNQLLDKLQRIQNAAGSCYSSQEVRTHKAHFVGSSLTANQTTDHVQCSLSGLQVSTQQGSAVSASLLQTSVSTLQPLSSIH